ncbi:hypothetical protein [Sinorhizobium medicae]|uniref:hypothetical protein n=1 Tax=Sinorhizobium medicae TaxID=110321 RepID=UPI0011A202B4|nr:hypothetical protein [Sinorhizobium medicae]MDX0523001.1 hypothetical protein [Sinorhizobium medicae]MDX1006723.1 hypothetical protein [Sinorhizobium medicae]TWA32932.1 hypothetical protein FB007_10912 [Sinorhizobium medicae]
MTGSTAHLRRDFLAGHWGNVRGLFWDKVRSRLLDGAIWDIGQGIGRFLWWNFHGFFWLFGIYGHDVLLLPKPTLAGAERFQFATGAAL